ncbi:MAG: hypothetical protein FJ278_04775, partial [Planctomycetes bacterium]|nr:hypothetical protein [Planctomycetota bacterium]
IMPDGQIVRDSKVVYVQPTRDLNITVEPDKATYRPGEDAVIRFQVTDQRGRSVPSALGLIIVDESVYALQEMQPGLEKAYFTLEKELLEPKYEIEFGPAITFEDMVKVRELEERRQTAAKVLLAKAEPPTKFAWQVNPAQARREKLDERLDKLSAALYDYAQKKPVGQLDPATKRWGYQPDLLTKLVKETDLKRADTLDPWGNPFGLDELGQVRAEVKFDNLSRLLAAQGLNKIYGALAQFKSREERRTKERTDPWTFPDDILDKLVEAKLVKKSDLIDPWGQPYVLTRLDKPNPTHYYTAQLRFYEVRSCGPDMVKGTADDVTNPYEMPLFEHRRRFVAFGRGRMLGADMAVMEGAMPMMAVAREEKAMGAAASAQEAPGAKPVVVREFFPETLLFQPSLITDDRGRAEQRVKMADSITTWRLTASASSLLGLLGSTTKGVTVFQDFFIDIDLPVSLTQGDQVHIPVAVYNYLKSRQRVRLVMDKGDWFQALGDTERTMDIGPGDVTVVYFPIAARQVGAHKLTVTGYGEKMSDAIRREIEVAPDGKEALVTFSGRLAKDVRETILIPDSAIDGASKIFVKVYPGVFSQVVEGVDKILQMPNGCFEQTSSTTYPNILVLDYMKRTRQETPELRMKAEQYINLGYQRLLTFEVQGGGFSWFGDKPANKILTAWGVTEFHDMAKVFEIDENVIRRTQAWLVQQQQQDGSWKPDEHYLHAESWGRIQNSNLLATAYIANALLESAYAGSDKAKRESVKRGLDYLVSKREDARDAYTLAFMLNCLASAATMDAAQPRALDEVIARLLDMKKEKGEHVWWESSVATVTHSHGPSAAIETTALVALGLIKCQREHAVVNKALGWLISQKDPNGTWHGTQATILVFKALLGSLTRQGEKVNAQVAIRVGDREEQIAITPENHDVLRLVDFKDQTRKGKNDVSIRVTGLSAVPGTAQAGEGNVMYQIVGRCYLPWPKFEMPVSPPLSIDVDYDRTSLKKDDTVTCRVRVASNLPGTCKMIMVDLGIPPGFSVLTDGLTAAVEKKTIQRFDMTGRQLMIYLEELTFGKPVEFSYQMKAKYPIRAQSPASTVYKYYNPEERATAKPVEIAVVQ